MMITVVLVSVATALVVICCIGTCGYALMWSRDAARRRVRGRLSRPPQRHTPGVGGQLLVEKQPENRVETLQRRFVAGDISLDEYEREIDRLEQRPTPA